MQLGIFDLIKAQYTTVPPVPNVDLSGKTVIVTGANVGLGFEAAKHFAKLNPGKLILACRNKEKGDAAVIGLSKFSDRKLHYFNEVSIPAIKQETGFQDVELWLLDLGSFASVRSFAERFEKEGGRLDILVENAANAPTFDYVEFTNDGWEASVQVNDLSTFLLALLLLPRMLETAERHNTTPRLVVLSSEVLYWAVVERSLFDAPNPIREYGHKDHLKNTYQITKRKPEVDDGPSNFDPNPSILVWNVFFVRALNDRLHRKPIIVNAANPGYCYSALRRNFTGFRLVFDRLMELFLARSTEAGGRIPVWAAVGAEEKKDELRGAYINLMKGKKDQDKFWNTLIEELGQVEPKVLQIVKENLTPPVTN
ncbi:hypothetical protein CPB84DRAFT_1845793 [Gymnopilus junonius]|uniref:NAD(P)-binding protein n=1 Tax=Gymnopilus junonius TaxID=109634 RepID=A0A9P5TNW2_GYMJU|nr:hypothetical protein CPB84DRAFT_1845793 [Gymnopilus junonius]